jgi:HAD superfamily hydrolase (TIGR01509 family)
MDWINQYGLFLFDLDGLLVNTEELHYRAYKEMLKKRGFDLTWDFATYFNIAQSDACAPRRFIYKEFPALYEQEPNWDHLYVEKKREYTALLHSMPVPLLPGVQPFLFELLSKGKLCAVVTHSSRSLVDIICDKNPLLKSIPHWFAREDYDQPKPSPDGYIKAITTLVNDDVQVIGFEDSIRGMRALLATRAKAILINGMEAKTRQLFANEGVLTFSSMSELLTTQNI